MYFCLTITFVYVLIDFNKCNPFEENQLVWLHSPVIPQGHSRKLHHPWTGPYRIIKRLSESDYKIKNVDGNRQSLVVHFDRLKLCRRARSDGNEEEDFTNGMTPSSLHDTTSYEIFGRDMELLENDQVLHEPCYPRRDRYAPDRFAPTVTY